MLRSENLDEKTYEQCIAEAIARIPLYSREWTNYNPSDPGITMLENLSAFAVLQQSVINETPEEVRLQLLKLAGFTQKPGQLSKVYVQKKNGKKWKKDILPGEKLYAQELCFEFPKQKGMTDCNLVAIHRTAGGKVTDLSELLSQHGVPQGIELYGSKPAGGEELHFYFDELPVGEELIFSAKIKQRFARNPFEKGDKNPFAEQRWFLRTKAGRKEVDVEDETWQFFSNGVIRVMLPEDREEICVNPENGWYELIVCLENCAYDFVPEVTEIRGMLSLVEQKNTFSAVCFYDTEEDTLKISHALLKNGYFELYEQNENYYISLADNAYERIDDTTVLVHFKAEGRKRHLMAVFSDEKVMAYRSLGLVYGYDNQEISLPAWKRVYAKEFSMLVKQENNYFIVSPDQSGENTINYEVDEENGKVIIRDCGTFEGAELLLGNYCIYHGEDGNIISGTLLTEKAGGNVYEANCCMNAQRGHYKESFEQVRRRFSKDVRTPATIVTKEDCEQMVRSAPGLSIHKVHATIDAKKNEVRITLKHNSKEPYPKLSPVYIKRVENYLSERRMLSTKIIICEPKYVPIRVNVSLRMKKNYLNGKKQIAEALDKLLDGGRYDRNFGDIIYFHEVYQTILGLACVEEILTLQIAPQTAGASLTKGQDIHLASNALSCPGEYQIETGI